MTANQNGSYAGKVALKNPGAGGGIGRATALAFARGGASAPWSPTSQNRAFGKRRAGIENSAGARSPSPAT